MGPKIRQMLTDIAEQLKATRSLDGHRCRNAAGLKRCVKLRHLSPIGYEHINMLGWYSSAVPESVASRLRKNSAAPWFRENTGA